uniref:Pre-mRNA-splicing factor 18 n=1 Tax=Euplotes crassus TaxID=5936 RepID=A0A7S3KSL2_EUPCR|mmetsp:Transcript_6421/g.5980  ORF Transcript_6421/g.5980 Transcript_6421/m.5980 type:complete len:139 (+) Transcript_6421:92-508(+)
MRIWEEDLADGKPEIRFGEDSYLSTKKSLKPLYKLLYNQDLNNEILGTLYLLARYATMKQYVEANDKYFALGIGNAPWPMGVTMVGIHARSGRSKILSSQVKHILNDETQNKYVVSIKRLLTICQDHYPVDPSKNVAL